jgi:adenylyltransferase/sulfurtransferase
MKELDAKELLHWQQNATMFELLDVREPHEREAAHIGGIFIPMGECLARSAEIPSDRPVVVYCKKGIRSAIVIQRLTDKLGLQNLYNLKGGITAWQALDAPGPA